MKIPKFLSSNWFIGISLTLLFLWAFLFEFYPLQTLENRAYDLMSQFRGEAIPTSVVIIGIDDKSIKAFGPWPWPRTMIADMVSRLTNYDAKVIGIHIPFPERDSTRVFMKYMR